MLSDLDAKKTVAPDLGALRADEIEALIDADNGFLSDAGSNGKGVFADPPTPMMSVTPAIRLMSEALTVSLTQGLKQSTSAVLEVSLVDIANTRIGNFLASLSIPSLMAVLGARVLSGPSAVIVDGNLGAAFFDVMLGESWPKLAELPGSRPVSAIEMKLFSHFITIMAKSLSIAFQKLAETEFSVERIETNPRFLNVGKSAESILRIRQKVLFGRGGGMVDFVFPARSLAPIESAIAGPDDERPALEDPVWEAHLRRASARARIEVEAVLDEFQMPLRRLLGLKPGETVMLGKTSGMPIHLRSGKQMIGEGQMGRSRDRLAVCMSGPFGSNRRTRPS